MIPSERYKIRDVLASVFGWRCWYCGKSEKMAWTIDHIIPKSHGGADDWNNMVLSCHLCNKVKADLDPRDEYELLRWMQCLYYTKTAQRAHV